jgi:hypothetical protein
MAAMNMVSAGGFSGGKLSFKNMPVGGRLCTLQENPHFWVPTIKDRPPDGMLRCAPPELTVVSACSLIIA